MGKQRGFVFIVFCIVFIISLLSLSCQRVSEKVDNEKAKEEVLVHVETVQVNQSDFIKKRRYLGNLAVTQQVTVIALASDKILEMPWEEGDYVKEGEVIAVIKHDISQKGIKQLDAQLKNLAFQQESAKREMKRVEQMRSSQIVSQQSLDKARDSVTSLGLQRQQLEAMKEQSRLGMKNSTVVAPISGVVTQKRVQVGDIASPSVPLCVLLDLAEMKVTLNIPEEDVGAMSIGKKLVLNFDAYPNDKVEAEIVRIMPYVNSSTRTNRIEARFKNVLDKDSGMYRYKPGMYVMAEAELVKISNALVVPQRALLLREDLIDEGQLDGKSYRYLFVLGMDGKVSRRRVEVGEGEGTSVHVLNGINFGDRIVVRGHHQLSEGQRVVDINSKDGSKKVALDSSKGENSHESIR